MYFPTGPLRFAAVKKKYSSDLADAPSGHQGFVFVTNQSLSPSQRGTLIGLAQKAGREADAGDRSPLIALIAPVVEG